MNTVVETSAIKELLLNFSLELKNFESRCILLANRETLCSLVVIQMFNIGKMYVMHINNYRL